MMKVKPVKLGKTERMSFSHIDEVISMPNLIEVQKNSYQWFLDEGLKEVFHDIGTIEDYTGNLALSFVDFRLDKEPKYSIKECKERDVTYAAPLRVTARLLNKETGEVKDQEIFMGDFPLMTDAGTFVINGAERAIVSQLVRSPGVFYGHAKDKVGNDLYSATMNPNRGAWLEYETDAANVFYVRIPGQVKIPINDYLRSSFFSRHQPRRIHSRCGQRTAPGIHILSIHMSFEASCDMKICKPISKGSQRITADSIDRCDIHIPFDIHRLPFTGSFIHMNAFRAPFRPRLDGQRLLIQRNIDFIRIPLVDAIGIACICDQRQIPW